MVHVCLEGGGGIAKSEEHYSRFVKAKRRGEGRLPVVFRSDEDVIVSPPDVKFGEDFASFQLVY